MPLPPSSRPVILCDNQPLTRDAVASYLSDEKEEEGEWSRRFFSGRTAISNMKIIYCVRFE